MPYRQLERSHADLFASSEIREVRGSPDQPNYPIKDVDLDEYEVVNASTSGFGGIGTTALSTCIAVCARGWNAHGQAILGLHHYDGRAEASEVLHHLDSKMRNGGAVQRQYYLVGGMILPAGHPGSLSAERALLSLRGHYDIRGVRLHQLEGEYDEHGEENMLHVLMTSDRILFSKNILYQSDD
ncbi:XopAK family type III secretion system effector [Trinickia dinghuensis]|uniref:Type III secretion system effector protein n=1 Tax=Trinickia dinghuensis TaxID=2291023 RepID=A0A3D8K5H4_9BURK|nr:XopAK family type III secretion system effector [Trinickia dinghuensis]RDV00470.1 type III secretion system effector protein [Trinickia dinghuensis]